MNVNSVWTVFSPPSDFEASHGEGTGEGLRSVHSGSKAPRGNQSHDPVERSGRNEAQHGGDGLAAHLEAERRPAGLEDLHQ